MKKEEIEKKVEEIVNNHTDEELHNLINNIMDVFEIIDGGNKIVFLKNLHEIDTKVSKILHTLKSTMEIDDEIKEKIVNINCLLDEIIEEIE